MNSEVIYRLARISQILRDNLPLSKGAITNLLNFGNDSASLGAILQLLCMGRDRLIKSQQSPNRIARIKIFLEQVLLCLGPLLETSPLLKYLATRGFQQFDNFCKTSNILQQNNLLVRSHGLYPPFTPNGFNSVFSRYSGQSPSGGNPHWVLSRYGVAQWFFVNKHKLNQQTREVYTFLLSQPEFIAHSQGLQRLWAVLYCKYTQIVLEQASKDSQINDERFITWNVSPFAQYHQQLTNMQDRINGYQKVIYYLILDQILQLQPQLSAQNRYFHLAFDAFSKIRGKTTEWEMLAYTLFLKMSELKQVNELTMEIRQKVRLLFENNEIKGLDFFLPLYFDFSEILIKILERQVNYQELNLSRKQKNQVGIFMLTNNKMDGNLIKYLSASDVYSIFELKQWQDLSFRDNFLPILDQHRSYFANKLQLVLGAGVQERIIQQHLGIFIQVWSAYSLVQQQQWPDLALLSTASLQKQDLRQNFHFMTIPRDCSKAVLAILMGYARHFDKNKLQMKTGGPALKHFRQFQEEQLPGLLSVLDENERNEFWKEWCELLRSDPEFVQEILHPHEPSTQV